jgi:hypothetical protein
MNKTEDQKKYTAAILALAGDIVLLRDQLNDARRRLSSAEDDNDRVQKRLDQTEQAVKTLLEPFMESTETVLYLTHPDEVVRELAIELINDRKEEEDNSR